MPTLTPPPADAPLRVQLAWHIYEASRDEYIRLFNGQNIAESDPINYVALRHAADMTLADAAKLSGYGIATINGLEKRGEGSKRLKARLLEIYQPKAA